MTRSRRRAERRAKPLIGALGLLALLAGASGAQEVPESPAGSSVARLRGEIGVYSELYSSTGGEARRPGGTSRLFLRSDLTLFGSMTVGLNLMVSTEGGSGVGLAAADRRQQINQIGISPRWSWGRADLGSFTDIYSPLTFSGIRVQGAGAMVQPGPLRLGAFVGRSQRAVAADALNGAFRRTLTGGRIGVGRTDQAGNETFLDLLFLRASDDVSSQPTPSDIQSGPVGSSFAVTPQENVVMSAVTEVPILAGRIVLSGEAAVSVFSRDRRAPLLDESATADYSSLLTWLITPRASTYGDVAYRARVELRRTSLPGATGTSPRSINASLGFRYVGAGYVSLGVGSLPADQRAVDGTVGVRFARWSATARGMRQNDNLLGQKLSTTHRNTLSGSLTYRLTRTLSSTLRTTWSTVANDAADPSMWLDYRNLLIRADQTYSLRSAGFLRALTVGYTYQRAGDDNPLRASSFLRTHDVSLRGNLLLTPYLTFAPSVGVAVYRQGAAGWETRQTYGASTQVRAAGGSWTTTLSLFSSVVPSRNALRGALTSRFRLTDADQITASIRSNHIEGLPETGGGFSEYTFSLGWSRWIQ